MLAFGSLPHRRAPARATARPATNQRARCAQPRDRPTDGPTHTPDRPQTDQPTSRPANQLTSQPADHRRLSFFLCERAVFLCVVYCSFETSRVRVRAQAAAGSPESCRWFAWPTSRPPPSFFLSLRSALCSLVGCVLLFLNKLSVGSPASHRWFACKPPLVRLQAAGGLQAN